VGVVGGCCLLRGVGRREKEEEKMGERVVEGGFF
jgi:hypothetical protein